MSYSKTEWKDRVVENPRTFRLQNNPDGTVTLIPAEGVVYEPGTVVSAAIMNNLETQYDKAKADIDAHTALTTTAHGGIVPASDVVTVATANKLLKLNADGKLPADITGKATGVGTGLSVKTGTISHGGTIPQTAGYANYMYIVSPSSGGGAFDAGPYDGTYVFLNLSVNQSTRVVTAQIDVGEAASAYSTKNGSANYWEIAWN